MTIELKHGIPHVVRAGRKYGITRSRKSDSTTDLLLAVGVALAVGAGVALVARERSRRRKPMARLERATRRGLDRAARLRERGKEWASRSGKSMRNGVPVDDVRDSVAEYLATARRTIDQAVSDELRDFRRAIRRQRKRLGA